MGGTIPGQVALGCIRKVPEEAIGSKLESSFPLWFLPGFPH